MKNLVLLLFCTVLFTACGDKKKENDLAKSEVQYKYNLVVDGIYEKDDSISVIYQKDKYYKYDAAIGLKVKGNPMMQRMTLDFPVGEEIENITIVVSTNKEQPHVTIKNISVKNGDIIVLDGDNYKHGQYFQTDSSFGWDAKNLRYTISHAGQYPPAMVGSEQLAALLAK